MGISAAQLRADSKPLILMYHSIVDYQQDPFNITIRPKRFEQHMRWLHRRGRRCTSVGELVEAWRNNTASGMVGLSFDDGYADFIDNALPVLRRYGFSATLFSRWRADSEATAAGCRMTRLATNGKSRSAI